MVYIFASPKLVVLQAPLRALVDCPTLINLSELGFSFVVAHFRNSLFEAGPFIKTFWKTAFFWYVFHFNESVFGF